MLSRAGCTAVCLLFTLGWAQEARADPGTTSGRDPEEAAVVAREAPPRLGATGWSPGLPPERVVSGLDPAGRAPTFETGEPACGRLAGLLGRLGREDVGCVEDDGEMHLELPDLGSVALRLRGTPPLQGRREATTLLRGILQAPGGGEAAGDVEVLFAAALCWSDRLRLDPAGRYQDLLTGRRLPFSEAFEVFAAETPPAPRPGRAALESLGLLTIFSAWYWTEASVNSKDWEYYGLGESLHAKFVTLEAWRFDDNRIHLNVPGHVFGGAAYYLAVRSNGHGAWGSLGGAFLGSLAWELAVEYRELVALNDLVVGSFGSAALGEAWFQLGEVFTRARPGPVTRALGLVFGAPQVFNGWLDGTPPRTAPRLDASGLPADVRHRLEVGMGAGLTDVVGPTPVYGAGVLGDLRLTVSGEVMLLPELGRPVRVQRFVLRPVRTLLRVDLWLGPDGRTDVGARANAVLLGYHEQAADDDDGVLAGHSLLLGLATDYQESDRWTAFSDTYGAVGILGPVLDLSLFSGPWSARMQLEAYPDFALVRARALPAYAATHPLDDTKSVLREQGYYYAWGATAVAGLTLEAGPAEVGGELVLHRFGSIEGRDRRQAAVTDDFHLVDGERYGRLWIGVALPLSAARLVFSVDDRSRWGRIGEVLVSEHERRYSGGLVLRY